MGREAWGGRKVVFGELESPFRTDGESEEELIEQQKGRDGVNVYICSKAATLVSSIPLNCAVANVA